MVSLVVISYKNTKRATVKLINVYHIIVPVKGKLPCSKYKYLSMPLVVPLHAYKQVGLPKQSNRRL
jgi:hypothetical protein